jgi:hypothetical protein
MNVSKLARAAQGLALLAAALHGQSLEWKDPGNYDHAGHLNKTPAEVDVPAGTPPGFQAAIARPAGLRHKITGMGFLSDGRMALAHWGGFNRDGVLYLMEGMGGNPEAIKAVPIVTGIWEPTGVKVLNDVIYYTAQDGIYKVTKAAGSPEKWESKRVSAFIIPIKSYGGDFPIAFNTAYSNGSFYYSTGAYKNFNPSPNNQGFVVRMDKETGAQEIMARGIRMPNGMDANAAGDLFYADNQGEYRPSSAVFHVVKGRHFGMAAPDGKDGNMGGAMTRFMSLPPKDSITPPAVNIPYRPGSASLTNMFHLDHTPFAGQFLIGDNAFGGVHRVFLEKVKGEYQGAYFQFSSVLDGGVQSFAKGPDGTIYGGTLGYGNNGWSWLGREDGLMKWKMDGGAFSSIVNVSSQREGFDLRFTEALAQNAINPDWFWVSSYRYEPTSEYGGPKLDPKRLKIKAIRASADRKTLALSVEGLEAGRVYRIMLSPEVKTAAGTSIWTRNAWYTLNRIGDAAPLATSVALEKTSPGRRRGGAGGSLSMEAGRLHVAVSAGGPYRIGITDVRGATVAEIRGVGPDDRELGPELGTPYSGIRFLTLTTREGTLRQRVNF